MSHLKHLFLASTLLATSAVSASAEINVVASIKPVHSLVAAVMEGVGEPGLIVEGAGSPHTYALKPSQAKMLESANVVFWIGHELEAFLEKPLETIGTSAKSIELIDAHDLVKLGFREGGAFEKHSHGDEAGHDDHAHEAEQEHGHERTEKVEHDHAHEETEEAGHDGHDHGKFDAHVWLDPLNAKAMVHEIEEVLAEADPANAAQYEANAEAVSARLDTLIAEVTTELQPVKDKGVIVFHDAYQYFENRFGLDHRVSGRHAGCREDRGNPRSGAGTGCCLRVRRAAIRAQTGADRDQGLTGQGRNHRPARGRTRNRAGAVFRRDPQHGDLDPNMSGRSQLRGWPIIITGGVCRPFPVLHLLCNNIIDI